MAAPHICHGSCHCGRVSATLRFSQAPDAIQVRACQCSFCRRHGALTVSDPQGEVEFHLDNAGDLTRYRFGPRTADFLLCAACGVYVGAVVEEGGRAWSVANVAGLKVPEFAGRTADPADYDAETREGRLERRRTNWTPTRFDIGPAAKTATGT